MSLRRRVSLLSLSVLFAMALSAPSVGLSHSSPFTPVTVTEAALSAGALPWGAGIHAYRLDNGLTVVLFPRDHGEKSVEMRLIVRAGSLQETENERGLAHFVEHMAFNGTTNFPDQTLFKSFEAHGISLGADVNAITSLGNTTYKLTVPATADLDHALRAFREWAGNLSFKPEHFEREREVIVEEWRLRQSVGTRLNNALQTLRYEGSASATRDPIGLIDVVRGAPVKRAADFYHRWYQPQNMTLLVVGAFDEEAMLARVANQFSDLKAGANLTPWDWGSMTRPVEPLSVATVRDKENSDRFLQVLFQHVLTEPLNTQNGQWRDVLEQLTLSILKDRLTRVKDAQEMASVQVQDASSSLAPLVTQVAITVRPKTGQTHEATLGILVREVNRLAQLGPTPEELQRVLREREAKLRVQAQNAARTSNAQWTNRLENALNHQMPLMDKAQEYHMNREFAKAVTPAHIQAAAQALLDSQIKIATVDPDGPTIPNVTKTGLRAAWNKALEEKATPFPFKPLPPVTLNTEAPAFKKATATMHFTVTPTASTTRYVFENGATLLVHSDKTLAGPVTLTVRAKGGTSVVDDGVTVVPTALSLPMKCGLGGLAYADIVRLAKTEHLRLVSFAESLHHGLRGEAPVQNLATLSSLLKARLTNAQTCDDALSEGRTKALAAFDYVPAERRFMEAILIDGFNHGDKVAVTPARIRAGGNSSQMGALEAKLLGDPRQLVVTVSGAAPAQTLFDRTAPWVATLTQRGEGFTSWRDIGLEPNFSAKDKTYAWSSNPKTMVQIQYRAQSPYSEEAKRSAEVLGQVANLRLRERLRTKASGVYVVQMNPLLVRDPKPYFLGRLNFTCAPERAKDLTAAAKAVMADLSQTGITQAEFEEALKTIVHDTTQAQAQTQYWSEALASTMGDPKAIETLAKEGATLQALTLETVNRWAKTWLSSTPVTYQLVPRPEGKVTK